MPAQIGLFVALAGFVLVAGAFPTTTEPTAATADDATTTELVYDQEASESTDVTAMDLDTQRFRDHQMMVDDFSYDFLNTE